MSFEFDFTQAKLEDLLKGNKEVSSWHEAMVEYFPKFEITTAPRVAAFIAQCGHESRNFTVLTENLNYSAEA